MKFLKNMTKNLDFWDIGLTKISVFFFTLWLIALIPSFAIWAMTYNPWIFFVIWIVVAIRPLIRAFSNKK